MFNPLTRSRTKRAPGAGPRRRGVTAVLAMMFMVLFGSLAAAMAIVSQGNLYTASSHLLVTRALGSVDTGLRVAQARLAQVSAQLRVEKGRITPDYADDLWEGDWSDGDGAVITPEGDDATDGVAALLTTLHAADSTVDLPVEYATSDAWLVTTPIVLAQDVQGDATEAFQITYVPIGDGEFRAVVTGYAWDGVRDEWITRTAQQDFRMAKRVKHAILGPAKIMIGKNVSIDGPIGARYDQVDEVDGHPLVVRSDFYGIDDLLDDMLEDFFEACVSDDTNGDNRLAIHHTIEGQSLGALNGRDYDGDTIPDNAFTESGGSSDGVLDEFDLFLSRFDSNGDGKAVLGGILIVGTPHESATPEFSGVDDDLAFLLDAAVPDRDGDGLLNDRDEALGYRDGAIDYRDRYAKIRGPVAFRTDRDDWEDQLTINGEPIGDYQQYVYGPIRPGPGEDPVTFNSGDDTLPDIDYSTFDTAQSDLADAADGGSFLAQAGVGSLWTPVVHTDGAIIGVTLNPEFDADNDADADYDRVVERVPYGAPSDADWYERPVIRNKVFKDVKIPVGSNVLFENCTFVGVTHVQTYVQNAHDSWRFYGVQAADLSLAYPPLPAVSDAQLDNDYFDATIIKPPGFDIPRLSIAGQDYVTTKPLSNNIRFNNCLFVGSIVADKPVVFCQTRNKLAFTGSTRFYQRHPDAPDDPDLNPDSSDDDLIAQSSMMAPDYSVDIGTNNASSDQDVNLSGLIIAGVLDVRGNTSIHGALLLTFDPRREDPALQHFGQGVGNPANYTITLGYFSPDQGDLEGYSIFEHEGVMIVGFDLDGDGLPDSVNPADGGVPVPFNGYGRITVDYDPDIIRPDGLIAPIDIEPLAVTYREGRLSAASAEITP